MYLCSFTIFSWLILLLRLVWWTSCNIRRRTGGYISFSDPFQISNPSQLFCNSSTLLKSFSKRKTFSKPSHYIQGGPSQSEYLLRSISNGVYVLLLKAILDFNTEKPSQIHLKSLSSDNLLKTISTHDLLWNWPCPFRKSLESKNRHCAHQSTYLFCKILWPSQNI